MGYRDLTFPKDSLFLVTGGAGFIGSNLCEDLLDMGRRVRCLDDLSTGHPRYVFIKGDVKDLDTCLRACEGADYVLHQAAWGSVPRSIEMPLFYCANNITGTEHAGGGEASGRKEICIRLLLRVRGRARVWPKQARRYQAQQRRHFQGVPAVEVRAGMEL